MHVVPIPSSFGRLLLTVIVGVIAWCNAADASECTMPSVRNLLAQAQKERDLQEPPRDLVDASPPQTHTIVTRDRGRSDQWLGVKWDASTHGALFLLDCAGNVLDVFDAGAVETVEQGPTVGAAGQTVLVTALTLTVAGYKLEDVALFGSEGSKINLLWHHTKHERYFAHPNESGEDRVYTLRFEDAGTAIRVLGSRSMLPPPTKERNGNAPPVSVTSLPTERYCWSVPQARYESCNARLELVPFVGCPSDGQNGPEAGPPGTLLHLALPSELAGKVSYYWGVQGGGVFAPRGWHCHLRYGSAGATLVVTPGETGDVGGPAVVASVWDGETSGRETVVAVAKRFFPQLMRSYIQSVESYDQSINWPPIAPEPFAPDTVHRVTDRIVEFVTPAHQDGYGTWETILSPSSQPIRGLIAISDGGGLSETFVRLAAKDDALASAIIRVEKNCLRREHDCIANED